MVSNSAPSNIAMVDSATIRIGDLSRRTGCNIETIRYYERVGLLPRPPRSAARYRLYDNAYPIRYEQRFESLAAAMASAGTDDLDDWSASMGHNRIYSQPRAYDRVGYRQKIIEAPGHVKPNAYTIVDDQIAVRHGNILKPLPDLPVSTRLRIRGMIQVRDAVPSGASPLISVVFPTYNAASLIDSTRQQRCGARQLLGRDRLPGVRRCRRCRCSRPKRVGAEQQHHRLQQHGYRF